MHLHLHLPRVLQMSLPGLSPFFLAAFFEGLQNQNPFLLFSWLHKVQRSLKCFRRNAYLSLCTVRYSTFPRNGSAFSDFFWQKPISGLYKIGGRSSQILTQPFVVKLPLQSTMCRMTTSQRQFIVFLKMTCHTIPIISVFCAAILSSFSSS